MGKKEQRSLGTLEVFSMSSGAMISSGIFVLPSIVFSKAGSAVIVVYLLAGLMMIPSLLAKAELATAMPKSGGTYFFVERSLGPLLGSFAGFASWFSIALKGAFALLGIGTFYIWIDPEAGEWTFKGISLACVLIFTLINLAGTHSSAKTQNLMLLTLLTILAGYIILGIIKKNPISEIRLKDGNYTHLATLAGMVFVSFGGLTKVASIGHKVKDPGRNLPRGMFLSFFVVILIYILAITVTVTLLDSDSLKRTLSPLTAGALVLAGRPGAIFLSIAAMLAFATTANAGILSASWNPSSMAEDGLLPAWLAKTNKKGVPARAVLTTGVFMAAVIAGLDLSNLIKTASSMMLILFLLENISLILMRESRIVSYRPLYKLPLYPFTPILGILISIFLLYSMGTMPLIISAGFFILTTFWTIFYHPNRPKRDSALFRVVERMAAREIRGTRLTEELGSILRERDGLSEDRFDTLIRKAIILDLPKRITRNELFEKLAGAFTIKLDVKYEDVLRKLHERETESTTMISDDLAIPHIVIEDQENFEVVLVRAKEGVLYEEGKTTPSVIFALAGSLSERNFHLQCLMAIAQITQTKDFLSHWKQAFDEEELRLLLLLADRSRK